MGKSQTVARFLPAEWARQSGVQLTFPHGNTDWAPYLDEAVRCFSKIAKEISFREKLLVVAHSEPAVRETLSECNHKNIQIIQAESDDTWARDHGGITVIENTGPVLLDFAFNGWGNKFAADKDNRITQSLFSKAAFARGVVLENHLDFVLEGGSIESDGNGTVLTTSNCLRSKNRNDALSQAEIESTLKQTLGAKRVLWLNNGFLAGDDTDSHIDTLARFCDEHTIAYVKCHNTKDEHFEALLRMESELREFRTAEGNPYRLVPLPMADEMRDEDGERLPATYANFLIINDAVLLPVYNSSHDAEAKSILAEVFPGREIIAIDCSVLVKQHGSLHCITMQYPEGVLK